jgi:hypothetical protein
MKKSLLILFVISSFFVACGPKINSTQQESLQQLTSNVDSVAQLLNALDSAELTQLTDNFFQRKNFIQSEMADTLAPETIFKLDAFIQLRKEMGFIRGEYFTIKNEANILNQQMVDLNHDVSKRLVEEKQFERYYALEKENYDELTMATSQLTGALERGRTSYHRLVEEIDSVITAYKSTLNE